MTTSKFKAAIKDAMNKYRIDQQTAVKLAINNYPDHFEAIGKADLEITWEEMSKTAKL